MIFPLTRDWAARERQRLSSLSETIWRMYMPKPTLSVMMQYRAAPRGVARGIHLPGVESAIAEMNVAVAHVAVVLKRLDKFISGSKDIGLVVSRLTVVRNHAHDDPGRKLLGQAPGGLDPSKRAAPNPCLLGDMWRATTRQQQPAEAVNFAGNGAEDLCAAIAMPKF